jgi:alpha-D-ribose 1-methylphosphonate 5-triphosphate diphosphatase PhnM
MKNIQILKQFLKDTAKQIKIVRPQFKEAQRSGVFFTYYGIHIQLKKLQYEYRHHHIAYCELRGKTRLQIEPKVREYHEPNESYVKLLKKKYAWTPEEIQAYEEKRNAKAVCPN